MPNRVLNQIPQILCDAILITPYLDSVSWVCESECVKHSLLRNFYHCDHHRAPQTRVMCWVACKVCHSKATRKVCVFWSMFTASHDPQGGSEESLAIIIQYLGKLPMNAPENAWSKNHEYWMLVVWVKTGVSARAYVSNKQTDDVRACEKD